MPEKISNIDQSKKQFKTGEMKIPVVFHASDNLLLKEETLAQFQKIAANKSLFHHIAVLSDMHEKKSSGVPAGTITASENFLFPQLLDAAPNCGMRMILTDLSASKDLPEERAENLFRELQKSIPTSKYLGSKVSHDQAIEIFRTGSSAISKILPIRIKNETENTFKNGDFFQCGEDEKKCTKREVRDVIPSLFTNMARLRLGILGATGSHFLYLMKVRDIIDNDRAQKFGIHENQYVFFMHTGSGIIGRYISNLYSPAQKSGFLNKAVQKAGRTFFDSQMKKVFENLRIKLDSAGTNADLFAYEDQSIEGRMFIAAHRAAGNYGFANRTMISHNLDMSLEKIFGRAVDLRLLYDAPHVYIDREKHYGKNVWVHRNGATRAMAEEPVLVAPLENTLAYFGVGTDNNDSAFFSANHEIGKVGEINLASVSGNLSAESGYAFNVYRQKKTIKEQQNQLYQNYAQKIIQEMEANRIMKTVASFEPIAVLSY